jgi:glycosyltransferase involved in cell wall biosynthesis
MRISVVIPTYNCAHFLGQSLDSVLRQTRPADEIILVDDGSADNTEALVRTRYPEITYLRQENAGASAARNAGIRAAKGDLIAFGDADDLWHPQRLEIQAALFTADPTVAVVGCKMLGFSTNNSKTESVDWLDDVSCQEIREISFGFAFARGGGLPVQTWLVKRMIFDKIGLLDTSLPVAEDLDILLRLLSHPYSAKILMKPLYAYRNHPQSLSHSSKGRRSYPLCQIRVLSQYQPQLQDPAGPLTIQEYWRTISQKCMVAMTSAIANDMWADAQQIASHVVMMPPAVDCSLRSKGIKLISKFVCGNGYRPLQRMITTSVKALRSLRTYTQSWSKRLCRK